MISVEDLVARAEISDVLARYAHAIDRGDRPLARACYHDDAIDNHGRINAPVDDVFAFFEQYGASLRATYHFLGVPLIVLDGDRAHVETFALYRRELLDPEAEVLFQGLRYVDVFERREEQWRIAHRTVVLDWEQRGTPAPSVPAPESWLRGGRREDDPAFAITEALAEAQHLRR